MPFSVTVPPADLDPDASGVVRRDTDERIVEESWLVFPASDTPEDILVRIRNQRSALKSSLQSTCFESPFRLEQLRPAEETHAETAEAATPGVAGVPPAEETHAEGAEAREAESANQ